MQKTAETPNNEKNEKNDERETDTHNLPDTHLPQQVLTFLELVKDGEDHPGGEAEDIIPYNGNQKRLRDYPLIKNSQDQGQGQSNGSDSPPGNQEEERCKKMR